MIKIELTHEQAKHLQNVLSNYYDICEWVPGASVPDEQMEIEEIIKKAIRESKDELLGR